MLPVSIRPAEPRDIAAITRIYARAVEQGTASFEIDPPDEAEMTRRLQTLVSAGFPFLVAEQGEPAGEVLGYGCAGLYRARPAYRFTVEDSIYVAPQMQRRGIGRALLGRVIRESEARGFRQMIAVIGDSGNDSSIGLHQSLGFVRAALLPTIGFKRGRWIDCVMMQRPLGPGSTSLPQEIPPP